jgi:hypothetical protein
VVANAMSASSVERILHRFFAMNLASLNGFEEAKRACEMSHYCLADFTISCGVASVRTAVGNADTSGSSSFTIDSAYLPRDLNVRSRARPLRTSGILTVSSQTTASHSTLFQGINDISNWPEKCTLTGGFVCP